MNELRRKRKELGLTQIQAANVCGVSRRTYQTYEELDIYNDTYEILLNMLVEMGDLESNKIVLTTKIIKRRCSEIFLKYPQVKCAYLYGSYARGEATCESDVDILVVCHDMGFEFFQMSRELKDALKKEADVQTQDQIVDNENLIENILVEGVKIYG